MKKHLNGILAYVLLGIASINLVHCGGAGGGETSTTPPPKQNVSISIDPNASSVALGQTQQFTASVSGSSNTSITWQVNDTVGGNTQTGTVSTAGIYTAPDKLPSQPQVTITAVSQADSTKTASATVTVTSNVSISLSPASSSLPAGGTQQFTATVSNDPGKLGATWTVNGAAGGNATVGTITSGGLYTAPGFPPPGTTVTIAAVSVADTSKSASATATIAVSNASLNGPYAFSFSGETPTGQELAAGSFTADGQGNLSAGLEDLNVPSGVLTNLPFTGTYSVGPDGRGAATINSSQGTFTFRFVVVSSQHGLLTEFNATAIGAGTFDRQDTTAFSNSALQGGYAFGFIGMDSTGEPLASAGQFTADGSGGLKSGIEDINDNGAVSASQPFTGTYSIAGSGRGTAIINGPGGASNFAFYVVSAKELDYVETDQAPAVGGTVFQQQASTFSNASLSGNYVFYLAPLFLAGQSGGLDGFPTVASGLLTADGSGNITSGIEDENDAGATSLGNSLTGKYSIASNGRGTAALSLAGSTANVTFYMVSSGTAFFLETLQSNSAVLLGQVLAQQGTQFSNSSLQGHYGFTLQGANGISGGPESVVGQIGADGGGNLTGTEDLHLSGQLDPSLSLTGTYSVASSGRGTATATSSAGTSSFVLYIISPSEVLYITTDSAEITAGLAELQF